MNMIGLTTLHYKYRSGADEFESLWMDSEMDFSLRHR